MALRRKLFILTLFLVAPFPCQAENIFSDFFGKIGNTLQSSTASQGEEERVTINGISQDGTPPPGGPERATDDIAIQCERARKDPDPCRLKQENSVYSAIEKQGCLEANRLRKKSGLPQIALNPKLQAFAKSKATEMMNENRFGHDTSDFIRRLKKSGLILAAPEENIAANHTNVTELFQAWMDSPDHRSNLLAPEVCLHGLSAVYSKGKTQYSVYWAHEFAAAIKGD